jgi:hypothetical protein
MVPLAGLEPALLAELDFESSASTNFTTGAPRCLPLPSGGPKAPQADRSVAGRLAAIAERLGNMDAPYPIHTGEIGDRPRHAHHTVIPPR